jgi:hypothetical protein
MLLGMRKHVVAAALAAWLVLGGSPTAPVDGPATAEAAVSIAYTLEELIDQSPWAAVVVAQERVSRWEEFGGSRRIVTYTRVAVQAGIYGKGLEQEAWVRSLGGAVDRIGQQVSGQADLKLKERALVFLVRTRDGALVVSGAAQGHFPITEADADTERAPRPARLGPSPSLGKILAREGPSISVHEVLIGLTPKAAIAKIREVKAHRDALRRKK